MASMRNIVSTCLPLRAPACVDHCLQSFSALTCLPLRARACIDHRFHSFSACFLGSRIHTKPFNYKADSFTQPSVDESKCKKPVKSSNSKSSLSRNLTDMSMFLTKHVYCPKSNDQNLVFSPLSIQVVLAMIAAGCEGSAQAKLLNFLKYDSVEAMNNHFSHLVTTILAGLSGRLQLNFVNAMWVDQSLELKMPFQTVVQDVFKASLSQADFVDKYEEARSIANSWARQQTRGLIKEIVPRGSVKDITSLIVANAVYFKGAWKNKFHVSKTKLHDFYLLNGSTIKVNFMSSSSQQLIGVYNGFKVLKLPYEVDNSKGQFSMSIFLPDATDGLPSLVEKLTSQPGFVERHLPSFKVPVGKFCIPKFKMNFEFEAYCLLKRLGIDLSCLTEIAKGSVMLVENIYHKAFIEVNEEGTEAAAVTAATCHLICTSARPPARIDFVADHPFLFLIREDSTKTVMFVGTLLNPHVS